MSGGGGGPSGETKYNWNDTLAPMWQQLLKDSAYNAYNNTYQKYPGQRIADLDPVQQQAQGAIKNWAEGGGGFAGIAANNQAQRTVNGDYLSGPERNPWAGATNVYSGYGPKFEQALQGELGDITNAYNLGTAADTNRMATLTGTYGGSAYQNAVAANQYALAKQLSNATANAVQNQYNNSAQLEQQRLNSGQSSFENERSRMMQAIAPGQHSNDQFLQGAQALMGVGDMNRSYQQDLLNQGYQDWQDQLNRPFKNADWLSGLYSRAQGGMSPNSNFSNSGYAASPFSQLIGGGLLAYNSGLFG